MQRLLVSVVICCGFAVPAADCQEISVTFQAAREQGRVQSRFLKESAVEAIATEAKGPDAVPQANVAAFRESVEKVLLTSCLACHGPEKSEGGLRVDQLNPDLLAGPDVEQWREILGALSKAEMPPEDATDNPLADEDRGRIVDWLSQELHIASLVRRHNQEHSSFRRLTNYEYNYALQDLLGLPYQLPSKLPPETASEDGFKNSSELLQMSIRQFQIYREVGLNALRRAIVTGERPPVVTYLISMQEEFENAASSKDESESGKSKQNKKSRRINSRYFISKPARADPIPEERRCLGMAWLSEQPQPFRRSCSCCRSPVS
jgi:mono/diheme cytochrome c family protein